MSQIIGLDIGGTKIEGIAFNGEKITKRLSIVTPKNLIDFKYSICELLKFLSAGQKIDGIGIGTAGVVDPKKGIMVISPNLRYISKFPIASYLQSQGFKNIVLDNDANCFVRAEVKLGKGKGCLNVIGVILGTGIGSGIVVNGQMMRGSHYSGGEIGQLMVGKDTLEHHYQHAKKYGDFGKITKLLVVRFADLINVFDPDCFVLGGSFSQFEYKKFLPKVLKLLPEYLINKSIKPKILVSNLKSAGALGAALLINK